MKKILCSLLLFIISPIVMAVDATPGVNFYGGLSFWQPDISGSLGVTETTLEDLGFDDENVTELYVALEHPIPFLPNIRVETASLDTTGVGVLSEQFEFEGVVYEVNETPTTSVELDYTDATLYYAVAMVDFGLTFRHLDASVEVTAASLPSEVQREQVDGVVPLLYVQTKIDIPGTGLFLAGNVHGLDYDDNSLIDFRISAGYELELSVIASISAEVGLRDLTLESESEDDFDGEIELSGVYARVNIKF